MASYVTKQITCTCCGKRNSVKMLKGFYNNGKIGLDTNPYHPAIYDRIVFCAHCGYATAEPYEKITNEMISLIQSEKYKEVLEKREFDETTKKLLLAGYLAGKCGNNKEAGYDYLLAYWYLLEKELSYAGKAATKAIKYFEKYLMECMDFDIACIIIDCYRKLGKWSEAKESIHSLRTYVKKEEKINLILDFEEKLIEQKDVWPHFLDEVLR